MKGAFYLTAKYIGYRPWRFAILIAVVALAIFLPLAMKVFVEESSRLLQARAASTPLLIGPKGSKIDLSISALYFKKQGLTDLTYEKYLKTVRNRSVRIIPLHTQYRAGEFPIVGTNLSYFEVRSLQLKEGRNFTQIGECVLGAKVAKERSLSVGDHILSTPSNTFDLAGVYPLKMKIVGVLEPMHNTDDRTVFVDLKTCWVIAGLGHGHDDLNKPSQESSILSREGNTIKANASLVEFNEVTLENLKSFHFHGSKSDFPISSMLAFPKNDKAKALLLGKYQSDTLEEQIVIPGDAISELIDTLFATRKAVLAGLSIMTGVTLLLVFLIFKLSFRLREREMSTYFKLGAPAHFSASLKFLEVMIVIILGVIIAFLGAFIAQHFSSYFLEKFLF